MYTLTAHFSEDQNGWNRARLDEHMTQVHILLRSIGAEANKCAFEYTPIGFSAHARFAPTMNDWASRSDDNKLVMANNALYAFLALLKSDNVAVVSVEIEYTDSEGRKRGIFYR